MKIFRKILCVVLVLVYSCSMVCFADSETSYQSSPSSFWEKIIHSLSSVTDTFEGVFLVGPIIQQMYNEFGAIVSWKTYCSVSDDHFHHCSSLNHAEFGIDDNGDEYCVCTCDLCGGKFGIYGSDLEHAYNDYVSELPAQVVDSGGGVLFKLPLQSTSNGNGFTSELMNESRFKINIPKSADNNGSTIDIIFAVNIPLSGICTFAYYPSYSFAFSTGGNLYTSCLSNVNSSLSLSYVDAGSLLSVNNHFRFGEFNVSPNKYYYDAGVIVTDVSLPVVRIIPDSMIFDLQSTNEQDDYNVYTRPASITGDYGIITESGDVQKIDSQTIVNEGASTVYNPVTGDTHTMTDWNYDYSDRSYHITTDNGDTMTVTYGDEHITIQEGSQAYNVYYLVESSSSGTVSSDGSGSGGSGSGGSSAGGNVGVSGNVSVGGTVHVDGDLRLGTDDELKSPLSRLFGNMADYFLSLTSNINHQHNFTAHVTKEATCTEDGVRTYTCDTCDSSYTEVIPGGHDWVLVSSQPTQYDDSGALVQDGYSIYECSRCGEQIRRGSLSGPPESNYTVSSEFSGIFSGIFGLFGDFTSFMFSSFSEFVVGGVKGFLGNLTDGNSSFFAILNPSEWNTE